MTRVILPTRSRLQVSQASSAAAQSNTPNRATRNAPRALATRSGAQTTSNYTRNNSDPGTSDDENEVSRDPIPSIGPSPSLPSTTNTDDTYSPIITPTRSLSGGSEYNDAPGNARRLQRTRNATSLARPSPHPSHSISPPPSISPTAKSSLAASSVESTELTLDFGDLRLAIRQSSQQPSPQKNLRDRGVVIDSVTSGEDTRPAAPSLALSPARHSLRRSSPRLEPVIHRVEDEEPPEDEFHNPDFQGRMSQVRAMLKDIASVLSSSSIHLEPDSIIKRHHQEAEKLSKFQPLATRTVGLVGDSGVGKSSLINSLLDRDSLARTTGRGSACTCVVTEYHFHAANNYVIDVEMFSEEELREQLAELLGSYRAGTGQESKDMVEIAIHTFKSMFGEKLRDKRWILTEAEDVVLGQFEMWARETRRLVSPGPKVVETLEDCASILLPLSSAANDPLQPSLWPYIRKIKVSLNAHILSKGLVLVDLPGLRDLNSARRNITQRYVVNCHEIFAVCEIKRASTDEGVEKVFEIAKQAWLERVGIICTNADNINLNEVHKDWNEELARPIRVLKQSLKAVESQIEDIKEGFARFGSAPDEDVASPQDSFALLMTLEKQKRTIDFQLQHRAITARNTHVVHELKAEYTAKAYGDTLDVFCVGNKMYQERRNLDKSVSLKYLDLSGIIEVRKHLVALVGQSQLRAAKNFLEHQVPALLRDIEIWVQSGAESASAEKRQAATDLLNKVEKILKKRLTSRRSPPKTIKKCLDQSFETTMWEGRKISKWTESSTAACMKWNQWHHASYAAFLRKKGDHETVKVGKHDWSQEVMECMATDTESTWNNLLSYVCSRQEILKGSVGDYWEESVSVLESEWPDSNDLGDELAQALDVRMHLLLDALKNIFDRFDHDIELLRKDTLTSLSDSMIRRIMSSVCEEALMHESRLNLTADAPYCAKKLSTGLLQTKGCYITKELQQGFKGHTKRLQQELDELILAQLDALRDTFDIAREENAVEENERDPEFRQRVVGALARARTLMRM